MPIRELPAILAVYELPRSCSTDPAEGMAIAIHPTTRDLVFQLQLGPERLGNLSYERPFSLPIPRDAALVLAHDILSCYAPEVAQALEDLSVEAQLRVIEGGGGAPEAS